MTKKRAVQGYLPRITGNIRERRLCFAGHCCRSKEELVSRILNWNSKHGKRKAERPNLTYLLKQDTGLEEPDIKTAMLDRSVWRGITVRANVST